MKRFNKTRRGSMLVMVGIMLVAFVGVGAIAADVGRFYVVTSELQTAADAAALDGAVVLQNTAGLNPAATVTDSVVEFVRTTNRANGTGLVAIRDSVQMAYYNPGPPSGITYDVLTKRANAVVVAVTSAPTGLFSQFLSRFDTLALSRQATAWVANVNSNCVKGIALPYRALYSAVSGSPFWGSSAPALDPTQFSYYMQQPQGSRIFELIGPNVDSTKLSSQQFANYDGAWRGIEYSGKNGKPFYIQNIARCTQSGLNAANMKALNSRQLEDWTSEGLRGGVCVFKPGDAGCYSSSGATVPGVTISVDWADDTQAKGSFGPQFRYVGKLVLLCYTQNAGDACNAGKPTAPIRYPVGTLVGAMAGITSTRIDSTTVLSNTPSNVQRVILVR